MQWSHDRNWDEESRYNQTIELSSNLSRLSLAHFINFGDDETMQCK